MISFRGVVLRRIPVYSIVHGIICSIICIVPCCAV